MSFFEKFVTEGNQGKRDELAKEGVMLDGGFLAQTRANTIQQEREKKCTQLCSMRPSFTVWWRNGKTVKNSSHSQKKWIFVDKMRLETKHRTEWCAATGKYRCMR